MPRDRRTFLRESGLMVAGISLYGLSACGNGNQQQNNEGQEGGSPEAPQLFFDISLAEWSLNNEIRSGAMDHLDFAVRARNEFDIGAVEYVSQLFPDKRPDEKYLSEMKKRAEDNGVKSLLIMIDNEGQLGASDQQKRTEAIQNHIFWLETAQFLGCHSIRVNAGGEADAEAVAQNVIDSLSQLGEKAAPMGLNVIVENHGGFSSNGKWLANIMKTVGKDNVGTLPDFGNFCIKRGEDGCIEEYDKYQGVRELMPFAKGVSAKSHNFNEQGQETEIDYGHMLSIVKEAGYTGYIGIEYEGPAGTAVEGIRATKALLIEEGKKLS